MSSSPTLAQSPVLDVDRTVRDLRALADHARLAGEAADERGADLAIGVTAQIGRLATIAAVGIERGAECSAGAWSLLQVAIEELDAELHGRETGTRRLLDFVLEDASLHLEEVRELYPSH